MRPIQCPQSYTKSPILKWVANNVINNNEIYYPKVTSTSKIATQLHLGIKLNPVMKRLKNFRSTQKTILKSVLI